MRTALFISLILIPSAHADEALKIGIDIKKIELCTSAFEINLYPFRKLSRQDYGYLTLLTPPIIAKSKETRAVLDAWAFSQEGRIFIGKVNPDLKWPNGSPISSRDVAISLAYQLPFREIGEKILIAGVKSDTGSQPEREIVEGIKIIDNKTFELKLSSTIANLQGVFREALTEGSRGNKFFIVRDADKIRASEINENSFLSRYKIEYKDQNLRLFFGEHEVFIKPKSKCIKPQLADSTQFASLFTESFEVSESHNKQALVALVPQKRFLTSKSARAELSKWLRGIFTGVSDTEGIEVSASHFLHNEPGSGTRIIWHSNSIKYPHDFPKIVRIFSFSLNTRTNIFGKKIEKSVSDAGGKVEWLTRLEDINRAHFALSPVKVTQGRQTWFQEISTDKSIVKYLAGQRRTLEALELITARSSATIPTDNITLQNFETTVFEEQSIVPLSRFNLKLLSGKKSPVILVWSPEDEWVLKKR